MQRAATLLLAGMAMAVTAGIARAQVDSREGIALQNQIAELRQELQQVQQSQGGGQVAPSYAPPQGQGAGGDTAAALVVRVGALEEQNRLLQGRVDDLANQVQRQHDELSKQLADLSFKLGQGGGGAQGSVPGEPAASAPQQDVARPVGPPPAAAQVRRTPELALREGSAALARRNYPAAAAAAREVLGNGHGVATTSAQLLLARAEGGQGQYKEAAADYYQAYNHAPRSPNAPVALLGVANSLIAMGDARDACQALSKLSAEFPGAAGVKAGAASARKRAACGR